MELSPGGATEEPESTGSLSEETIAAAVATLLAPALAGVDSAIHRFHDRIAAHEQTALTLHAHVESLQQDQTRSLLKPAFERLATLHADAIRFASEKQESDPPSSEDFAFFAHSIEELLGLYDLDSVGAVADGDFDPKIHHAQRALPTHNEHLAGKIQRVIRQGFAFAGAPRVFLPARVSVYRYEAASAPSSHDDAP